MYKNKIFTALALVIKSRLDIEEEEKVEQEVVQVPEIPETPTGVDQKDLDDAFNELTKKKD